MTAASGRRWAGQAIAPPWVALDPKWTPTWVGVGLSSEALPLASAGCGRVSDRTRTGDRLDHNQELYQLSYAHRAGPM